MKHCLLVLLLTLGLTACNDNDDHSQTHPIVEKPILAPSLDVGTYTVSMESGQDLPIVGKYYAAPSGEKLLILNDEQDRAKIVMHYDVQSKSWQSNQADQNFKVQFSGYEKIADQKLNLSQLTGMYDLSFIDGSTVPVEINAQGQIISKDPNCMFTAKVSESTMANTATYQFTNNQCNALKNNTKGYIVLDEELEPAHFRLVSDANASQDIWAFAQS